jgi:polar amino acid transport system substrate-binding protein
MRRVALMLALTLTLGIAVGTVGQRIANAQQLPDARVGDLVRAGKVRVALLGGVVRGIGMDLVRTFATRLGIEVVSVEYPTPEKVLESLRAGTSDVGFLVIDPARAAVVDFSPPYLEREFTYLVPAGSRIRSVADADQPGVRLAVVRMHASGLALNRIVKHAELLRTESLDTAFDLLRTGHADAFASAREDLVKYSIQLPGSRVLADRYGASFSAMAVPKGQAGRLAYVSEFIEEAKASGLVQRLLERAKQD